MADVYIDIMTQRRLEKCRDREEGEIRGRKVNLCSPDGNPLCPYRAKKAVQFKGDFRTPCNYFEMVGLHKT